MPTDISSGSEDARGARGQSLERERGREWEVLAGCSAAAGGRGGGAGNNFYGAQAQRPRLSSAAHDCFGFFNRGCTKLRCANGIPFPSCHFTNSPFSSSTLLFFSLSLQYEKLLGTGEKLWLASRIFISFPCREMTRT